MSLQPRTGGSIDRTEDSGVLGLRELLAIGVGGMVGGGIFSVLGIAAGIAGHATPLAFALGSVVALAAGYSYVRLALTYRDDGASFTYVERAFPSHRNVAAITGWTVVVGYIGTLALYAFTFGAYGADLLGHAASGPVRAGLSLAVLLFFMLVNIRGTRSTGRAEDLIVFAKLGLLGLFGVIGLAEVDTNRFDPLLDEGGASVFTAAALVFVAFEGFQLITNAVLETENPDRNVPRGVFGSIVITSAIYVGVAVAAIGTVSIVEIRTAEEYALAVVAEPVLGHLGVVLIGVAALLSTSSAINATVFGASRMMWQMGTSGSIPRAFSFRNRRGVPWSAVATLIGASAVLTFVGGLGIIAAFSSLTFLIVSSAVSIANLKLHRETGSRLSLVLLGLVLMAAAIATLLWYLWTTDRPTLLWIAVLYGLVISAELLFSKRAVFPITGFARVLPLHQTRDKRR